MSKKKIILLAVTAALLVFMLVPFPIVVARACVIQVVDADGKPLPDSKVSHGWAYSASETSQEKYTGSDGDANFERRIEKHSLLRRAFAILSILNVHGSGHISDGYLISFPAEFTVEIAGDYSFRDVEESEHYAQVDLSDLPRDKQCHVKFTLKKKAS